MRGYTVTEMTYGGLPASEAVDMSVDGLTLFAPILARLRSSDKANQLQGYLDYYALQRRAMIGTWLVFIKEFPEVADILETVRKRIVDRVEIEIVPFLTTKPTGGFMQSVSRYVESLQAAIAALQACTESVLAIIQAGTSVPAAQPAETAAPRASAKRTKAAEIPATPAADPAPVAEAQPAPQSVPEVKIDYDFLKKKILSVKREAAIAALAEIGAKSLPQVPAEKYAELNAKLDAIAA